jgi:hypothetical protein
MGGGGIYQAKGGNYIPPQQIRKGLVCCQAIILSTKSPPATRQQNNVNHLHDEKLLLNHTSTISYIFIR